MGGASLLLVLLCNNRQRKEHTELKEDRTQPSEDVWKEDGSSFGDEQLRPESEIMGTP